MFIDPKVVSSNPTPPGCCCRTLNPQLLRCMSEINVGVQDDQEVLQDLQQELKMLKRCSHFVKADVLVLTGCNPALNAFVSNNQ